MKCAVLECPTPDVGHCNVGHYDGKSVEDCVLEYRHTSLTDGVKAYFCTHHQQWVYEFPVVKRYIYADESYINAFDRRPIKD